MKPREKILAILTGTVVLVLFGTKLVQWTVIAPFQELDRRISDAHSRREKIGQTLASLSNVEQKWKDLAGRTLGDTPDVVKERFEADLQQLLQMNNLHSGAKVTPSQTFTNRDTGITEITFTVETMGSLQSLTDFLCAFERRNYISRIEKLTVTPERLSRNPAVAAAPSSAGRRPPARGSRPGQPVANTATLHEPGPGGGAAMDGPPLKINLTAKTIVVPPVGALKFTPLAEIQDQEPGRLARPLDAYREIYATNIFRKYVPPPERTVVSLPESQPAVAHQESLPPPPPPPPPPPNMVLVSTISLNNEPVAYVRNNDKRTEPPKAYRVNDPLHDGRVVLIHPLGVVVRTEPKGAPESGPPKDYFYKLGESFAKRQELDPEALPDVKRELDRALREE